jgi:hypothetical protein
VKVTFTKTAERRYRVSVEGPGIESSYMDPAPGYDPKLPHDAAHFIVENELGINGGVFGQLAAGGNANTFRTDDAKKPRRVKKRGGAMAKENRQDALFSEHAVWAAQSRWNNDPIQPETKISPMDIDRICAEFDEFSEKWSNLPVGGSVTIEWKGNQASKPKRRAK